MKVVSKKKGWMIGIVLVNGVPRATSAYAVAGQYDSQLRYIWRGPTTSYQSSVRNNMTLGLSWEPWRGCLMSSRKRTQRLHGRGRVYAQLFTANPLQMSKRKWSDVPLTIVPSCLTTLTISNSFSVCILVIKLFYILDLILYFINFQFSMKKFQ